MISVLVKQFRRNQMDDGRNDKNFDHQNQQLKAAQYRLLQATQTLIEAAKAFQESLYNSRHEQMH